MALNNDFYSEIFTNEQKWIELINSKLLNIIYCNLALKPFYLEKKSVLEQEYNLTNNKIIGQILSVLDNIINKIDSLDEAYKNNQNTNIKELIPLFLATQMNNIYQKQDNNTITVSDRLQIKKQVLENEVMNYDRTILDNEDYVYDDFPEEIKTK
ncbi:MAG: hypothetical protein E7174_00950 [Firmicutes bacterium]|nr:hypothetical protein [Bacillota bacterium]